MPAQDLLRLAASVESASEHPIAEAVVRAAEAAGTTLTAPDSFRAVPGQGASAEVEGRKLHVGNLRFMDSSGIALDGMQSEVERLQTEAKTAIIVAVDERVAGVIGVSDSIKPEAAEVVARLQAEGLQVVMITGDNQQTAAEIAAQAGIREVFAEVLPGGKAAEIERLQAEGKQVAMVGDGINDAPALAKSDVGIAIGTGTDIAMAAAPIVLISGNLVGVNRAIEISRMTLRTIKENLFWAFIYNIILIPAAAAGLLSPVLAAGAMAFSSVFVVGNSLRLGRKEVK